ncbi:PAS domain-containing hybrid sensor histidine kinase/response regulator [Bacteroides graminisolvens]|uniref:PAS domain-containing hybrid sensor histidine kinase/response regulator n=1 Tax=Bacteroides graminisolvens TaxID=477666 RepID=UPI0024096A54|nr:response regulator [Bacteroides graminisolvens]
MDRILRDASYSQEILQLTADTLILVDAEGVCRDVSIHSDLCFMQEKYLLGKNVFDILPEHTRVKVYPEFKRVLNEKVSVTKNFKLPFTHKTYYFKCIMQPYRDMVLCQYRDITERCNIRLELERTNEKLLQVQKTAQISVWKYNSANEIITSIPLSLLNIINEPRTVTKTHYAKYIQEDDQEKFLAWLENCVNGNIDQSFNYLTTYSGLPIYIKVQTYSRTINSDGSVELEGYAQNISNEKKQETNINTLTHAIDNAAEEIFAAKEDGTLLFVNKRFRELHKVPEDVPIANLKIHTLPYGAMPEERWRNIYAIMEVNSYKSFTVPNPIKENKELLALEIVTYTVVDENNEKNIWIFGRDISDQIKFETEIKRTNQILDVTMKNLPASIVVKDVLNNFSYIYRNRDINYNIIRDYKTFVGKTDFDVHPYDEAAEKRLLDIEVYQQKKVIHDVLENLDNKGHVVILDRKKVLIEHKDFSPIILNIEWDITELELTKRELTAAKEKAERSDRFKSSFLANMSHEIRTPLNAIVGFSRIIADCDNFDERREYYSIVEANNERLLGLINEILDLSKIESGIVDFSIGPVNLFDLCKEIHNAHIFRCPQGVELIFEKYEPNLVISSDKNRLFQVYSNLIGNAFKFVSTGSVKFGYSLENKLVKFYVTDSGIGIAEDKINKIFDRFVKGENSIQGTGLGLSICKTIIDRLGGNISVESTLGIGTTFTFTLPCGKFTKKKTHKLSEEGIVTMSSSKSILDNDWERANVRKENVDKEENEADTILIAEDMDSNFELLNAILSSTYNLIRARDGIEAVSLFNDKKPDLILMDIKMPNMDGLDATRIIRELSPDIPIIALSAYAYKQDTEEALAAGCNDFLAKPLSAAKLKQILNKWLKN